MTLRIAPALRRIAVAAAPLLAVTALPGLANAGAATPAPVRSPLLVGIDATVGYGPWRFPGDDGRQHVTLTVQLVNELSVPLVPDGITVTAQDGRRLTHLSRAEVLGKLEGISSPAPMTDGLDAQGAGALSLDMPARPSVSAVRVHVHYSLPEGTESTPFMRQVGMNWTARTAVTPIIDRAPLALAPPLRGGTWLNVNACCMASSHEYTRLDGGMGWKAMEVFAIDFIAMRNGRTSDGDGTRNAQYAAYGRRIVSATDGVVVSTRNDMPDIPPLTTNTSLHGLLEYAGNHVTVKVTPGVYVMYAHMIPGSVRVHTGQRVTVGAPLGRLGNSGNTSEPHLHFEVLDGAQLLGAQSLPFVFRAFTRLGTPTGDGADGVALRGRVTRQRDTYPMALGAYTFPTAGGSR